MKARLAKKIMKASTLYNWYCNEFGKKPYKNKYWLQNGRYDVASYFFIRKEKLIIAYL